MTQNINSTPLETIAAVTEVPEYKPDEIKTLLAALGVNEKAFALLMNVTHATVRMWTAGAAQPCGVSRRLMQLFGCCPEVITALTDGERSRCR